jgi:hypothetical protein
MLRNAAILSLLLLPGLALAQPARTGKRTGGPDLLQQRHDRLTAHRGRLEGLLETQVKRISRLKAQSPGVRKDFQLRRALRDNQQLATRLSKLQEQIRSTNSQLVDAYDRAIANAQSKAERARLRLRRDRLSRSANARSRIVTREKANPLDSAEDLEEKADLLKDSEEKVRRQLRRIQRQIVRLSRRARLRRHSSALDDAPFVEDAPRLRRISKAPTKSSPTAERAEPAPPSPADGKYHFDDQDSSTAAPPSGALAADAESSGEPSPGAPAAGGGSWTGNAPANDPSAGLSNASGDAITGVMDPNILRELEQAQKSGNLKDRLTALKKARRRLEQMARRLGTQAQDLRKRAKAVK